MNKKTIIIVLDGAADRPHPKIDSLTPLAFANTPNLDRIACAGVTGMVDVIGGGRVPVSSSGAMSLLGYDVTSNYPGETMLEAIGILGGQIQEGDLVVHVSFATGDGLSKIIDRRVCRDLSPDEGRRLAEDVTDAVKPRFPEVSFDLLNYRYYRNVLVIRAMDGRTLSDQVSNTDPAHRRDGYFDLPNDFYEMRALPCLPLNSTLEAEYTAQIINDFIESATEYLTDHPINKRRYIEGKPQANLVLTRNASIKVPKLQPFPQSLGMIVEMPGERAVGELILAKFVEHSFLAEPSVEFYKNLMSRVLYRLNSDIPDVLYVHTKGPDEPGHDGNPVGKVRVIEMIDQVFLKGILSNIDLSETTLIVTSDHATPCETRVHTADHVPIAICAPSVSPDGVEHFDERNCAQGRLGVILGKDVLSVAAILT